MRRIARFLLLAMLWPAALWAQQTSLTLDEARAVARQALLNGTPQIALEIGKGLLDADPRDPDALLIVAAAQAQLGNPINGRRAAGRAYRYSDDPRVKLDAATIAAQLAARADRLTLTQVWLRRASLHIDDPEAEKRLAAQYRRARDANPWSFNLSTSLRPSSNVNNGAESGDQFIDELGGYNLGTLSASAQALSGMIAEAQVQLGYRLHGSANARTELLSRVQVRRVDLSDAARAKADQARADAIAAGIPASLIPPDPMNRDFGSTYVDLRVQHRFRVGDGPGNTAMIAAGIGGYWYGTEHESRLARVDASRTWALPDRRSFTLYGSVVRRDAVGSSLNDTMTYGLLGAYSGQRKNGAQWSLSLRLAETTARRETLENTTWGLRARYSFAQSLGPAKVTAGLSLSDADYPVFTLPDGTRAPGGRQDLSAYADLTLFFEEYDYLGFAPEVTMRVGRRESNVSRYDTRELSVSLGVQSKF